MALKLYILVQDAGLGDVVQSRKENKLPSNVIERILMM